MLNSKYIYPKKTLKKSDYPDTLFISKFYLSPYIACSHACSYCDGRSEKYHIEGNFDNDIKIRKNIAEVLKKELTKEKENGVIMIMSGVSDPYQHCEYKEKLMPKILNVIKELNYSCSITTKSSMINRDFELLRDINNKNKANILMSLTFMNDSDRKIIEPLSSCVEQRLQTLKRFKDDGFFVGVLAMPFIPFINDDDENIFKLLKTLKDMGVDYVIPGSLTLRPGINKNYFLEIIKNNYTHLLGKYKDLYSNNKPSGMGKSFYFNNFYERFYNISNSLNVSTIAPHYVYKNRFHKYDEIYIILSHLKYILKQKNYDTYTINKAFKNYTFWLSKEKHFMKKNRSLSGNDLDNKLLFQMKSDILKDLFISNKLYSIIKKTILNDHNLDYSIF